MITWRASRKPWSLSIRTRGKGVVVDYRECHTTAEVLLYVGRAEPSTVIFDVEPLIAHWDTGDTALTEGMSFFVNQLERTSAVDMIVFATNSKRRPSAMPSGTRSRVQYIASAMKPFRTRPFLDLPTPGIIVGDQIATDGILANRLGYTFLRYRGQERNRTLGPRLMGLLGFPLLPVLFRRS